MLSDALLETTLAIWSLTDMDPGFLRRRFVSVPTTFVSRHTRWIQ